MAIKINGSNYGGEVLEHLLVKATTGNELVQGGHIRLEPNVSDKLSLPRVRAGKVLQKRKEQPESKDSKGDFEYDERELKPLEFMAYTEFNPRSLERIWRPFQPKGELVFSELPPHVQNVFLAELAKIVDFELGEHFVTGEEGAGDTQFFNGILTRAKADKDILKIPNPAVIDESNVIDVLGSIAGKVPKAIRKHIDLKMFTSHEDFDLYDSVITRSTKGKGWDEINKASFKNIRLVPLVAMPKDDILCTIGNTKLTSNLWAGVSYVNDAAAVKIDKVTNAGERCFFKMLMKADTQLKFGEDAVLYSRKKP